MSNSVRALSLVLALLMLVPALASADQAPVATRTTVENFVARMDAGEAIPVDVRAQMVYAFAENADMTLFADVTAGAAQVFSGGMWGTADESIYAMEGLTANYAINNEEAKKQNEEADEGMYYSTEMLFAMLSSMGEYAKATEALTPERRMAYNIESYQLLGIDLTQDPKKVTTEVLGEELELYSYETQIDDAMLDATFNHEFKDMPEVSAFFSSYLDFVVDMMKRQKVEISREHAFADMVKDLGGEMTARLALLFDETGERSRVDLLITLDYPLSEGDKRGGTSVRMGLQTRKDERGQHGLVTLEWADDAAVTEGNLRFDLLKKDGLPSDTISWVLTSTPKKEERWNPPMRLALDATHRMNKADERLINGTLSTAWGSSETRVKLDARLAQGESGQRGPVELIVTTGEMQKEGLIHRENSRFRLGFDLTVEQIPMSDVPQAPKKPVVRIAGMSKEDQQKLDSEVSIRGIMSYGALMATPGVARLISDATIAAQRAFEEMLSNMEQEYYNTQPAPSAL